MSSTYETFSDGDSDTINSESDGFFIEPMRLCCRPPQFYCASSPLTAGKTSTTITEMESMIQWFLNAGAVENLSLITTYKRIVHLIFVNNNLIEGEQWADRLCSRGIQKMRIFSSKSDINTAGRLYELIAEGQYDDLTDTYTPIDYVLQCTNGIRLSDYCEDKQSPSGPMPSILKRMAHHHKDVGFVIWSDEIDKLTGLWKPFIPKLRKFGNVIQINGITATPHEKYWELVHCLGFGDIPLIGSLPDPSDYRTISDHKRIYTNLVNIKSPVSNFEYLLKHSGEISYTENDPETKKEIQHHTIPSLTVNRGVIYYVPGEARCKTHTAIASLANEYGKNSLVINGKFKGFKYADGRSDITVDEYKQIKIEAGEESFQKMAYMDIAIHMYHDPTLELRDKDLVITGFNCITRGITFNRPDFQFEYVILSAYHYKEGSKEVEEIIQAVGRAHGNSAWVKEGIVFLSPKYILDMVEQKIKEQIQFLRTAPKAINYADVFREKKGIPIKILIHDSKILETICSFGNLTEKKRGGFIQILQEGITSGAITIEDPNNYRASDVPFNLQQYALESKRILEDPLKAKNYRFSEFLDHFTKRVPYGQSVKEDGKFQIDITNIDLTISLTQRIEKGTGFISFMFKQKSPDIITHE
jgi:hypothetical protein